MARWLFLAFVTVPLAEIFVIVQVGRVIGGWWTVGLLFAISLLGAWLVRTEGRRAWTSLLDTIASGRAPTTQLLDAALVLVGGTLLLTPGFVTDAVGAALLLPWTRPWSRRLIQKVVTSRLRAAGSGIFSTRYPPRSRGGPTIPGEVIDNDDGSHA